MTTNTQNALLEGMERLGLIATRIRQNQGETPRIEIDIILQELRNLYMTALQLDVDGEQGVENGEWKAENEEALRKAEEEVAAARQEAEEAKRKLVESGERKAESGERRAENELSVTAPSVMQQVEGNENDLLFDDPLASEPPAVQETPATPSHPTQGRQQESLFDYLSPSPAEEPPAKPILAETLGRPTRSIEEQLATTVQAQKVDDLRTIININDKFSFMSELFHNNMKAYNDFILHLNALASREEALEYVATIASQYGWQDGSSVVKTFYRMFDRKF